MVKERILHRGRKRYPLYPNQNLIPVADDTWDIGSSTREWQDIYIDGKAYVDMFGEDIVISGANQILPERDDAADIGSGSKQFKDIYIDGVGYIDDVRAEVNMRLPTASATASGLGSVRIPNNEAYLYAYVSGAAAHVWASVAVA
jgi:hypothetical protein